MRTFNRHDAFTLQALTPRQRDIYQWLQQWAGAGNPPPNLEQACEALGLSSRGSLHKHIQALVEHGLVEPLSGLRRGIRLTSQPAERASGLPLLGVVAAGRPLEALENPEHIDVPDWLRTPGECFVLTVRGDSMLDEGIFDGDRVVIEHRDSARNGDIVVALINGEEATLKRIEQRHDSCVLHAANSAYEPQCYAPDQVQIRGVLVSVMRRYP